MAQNNQHNVQGGSVRNPSEHDSTDANSPTAHMTPEQAAAYQKLKQKKEERGTGTAAAQANEESARTDQPSRESVAEALSESGISPSFGDEEKTEDKEAPPILRQQTKEQPEKNAGGVHAAPATDTPKKEGATNAAGAKMRRAKEGIVRRLRTYKDDATRAMKKQRTSRVSAAAAESRRRADTAKRPAPQQDKPRGTRTILRNTLITVSVILILAGLGGAGYLILFSGGNNADNRTALAPPSFIFTETEAQAPIGASGGTALQTQLQQELSALQIPLGGIGQLVSVQETEAGRTLISAGAFLERLGVRVPAQFRRAFEDAFMLGAYNGGDIQPFIILKPDIFDITFAGMLEWEQMMYQDLQPLLGGTADAQTQNTFSDTIIKNQDVRILQDARGTPLLLYSFTAQDTLVITTTPKTFRQIFGRLTAGGSAR